MFMCKCFNRNQLKDVFSPEPEPFFLPAPIPQWPPGEEFSSRRICIGEIEVFKITRFERICSCTLPEDKKKSVTFYKPSGIPDGFHSIGHYCQLNGKPLHGYVLVAREVDLSKTVGGLEHVKSAALRQPLDYLLEWSPDDGSEGGYGSCGYFWLPHPPEGYKAMGFLVTNKPGKPDLDEVRCVRADLTDACVTHSLLLNTSINSASPFQISKAMEKASKNPDILDALGGLL